MNNKNDFKGLWPAMLTPVDRQGEPAIDALQKLVALLVSQGVDGLYLLGSTGQGVLFTEEQRKKVAAATTEAVAGKVPVIVQVGAKTTDESVRLARHARQVGADGISCVAPIYYGATAAMTLEHYRQIAAASDLPFFPYQLGDNSIPGEKVAFITKLMEIPNVAGMKLTTNQLLEISAIHNLADGKLKLFSGADELYLHAMLCGTVGAIGSFYNLWFKPCKLVMTEFRNGNFLLAKEFMLTFQSVIDTVMPNVWTFLRQAMQIRYNIDIGPTKAPLGNTHTEWKESEVIALMERVESVTAAIKV
jgi:N-acetylneuraminate lyase